MKDYIRDVFSSPQIVILKSLTYVRYNIIDETSTLGQCKIERPIIIL